jgi:hypothetical protein
LFLFLLFDLGQSLATRTGECQREGAAALPDRHADEIARPKLEPVWV